MSDRLNYQSPIPLNPEQLKILRALKNEKCKYVVVEGPPGTGKSHTISAIAFVNGFLSCSASFASSSAGDSLIFSQGALF